MATPFAFDVQVAFTPAAAEGLLRAVPAAPGIFALRGEDPAAEPYLARTTDLRRRLRRLLAPPEAVDEHGNPVLSRRLNLRDRIRSIAYTRTGSEFESTLLLYRATRAAFGAEQARRRLRLYTPFFIRVTLQHAHPRAYVTNKLSRRSLPECIGPFPSRAAAERYCDAVLDLFQLRRCYEDLVPHPDHPGCAYGEMNKCLQPCKGGTVCSPATYSAETTRVSGFFRTRGQSLLDAIARDREAASEAMDFEAAAAHHRQWDRARAASLLADELVRPVEQLRAVVLQPVAPTSTKDTEKPSDIVILSRAKDLLHPDPHNAPAPPSEAHPAAAVFLLDQSHLCGPARLSTLGVRAVREQTAVGSSLFAQPLMLAPVPLNEPTRPTATTAPAIEPTQSTATIAPPKELSSRPESAQFADAAERPAVGSATTFSPEDRARALLTSLESQATETADLAEFCDALSLFRRWYYRPEKQRTGECFLPNPDTSWPIRRILNGAARIALGPPAAVSDVDREAAKVIKTKKLHEGREGIERSVPVLPRRARSRNAPPPATGEV